MKDLVALVADKNLEAVLQALVERSKAIRIRPVALDLHVHPRRDPGCFHEAVDYLRTFRRSHHYALVILDRAWAGAPPEHGAAIEAEMESRFRDAGMEGWARVVVIDPELEAWVWSDSPHVDECLGWAGRNPRLRTWLVDEGLWADGSAKPTDPKAAVERALYVSRRPRSSAIYRRLAEQVSFGLCEDRAFIRLLGILREWFPPVKGHRARTAP